MRRIKEFFSDGGLIIRNKHLSFLQKIGLFFQYANVSIVNFLHRRVKEFTKISFKGNNMNVASLSEFFMLVREVILQEPYYFKAENDHPVIFDCGANIGIATMYLKTLYPHSRITTFEPSPKVCDLLRKNIEENKWSDVTVHGVALSDREGAMMMYERDNSLATTLASEEARDGTETKVKVHRLSRYIETDIDLLKLDVQLSEVAVMRELYESGKLKHVKKIIMEYHYKPGYGENSLSELLSILEKEGYVYTVKFNAMKPDYFTTYIIETHKRKT